MNRVVLIIDDSPEVRENMKEILELSNYTVHTAQNGKEGLELAHKNQPDLILCDIMMPELDGYGVLRGLSNHPKTKNIPFIFISAKSGKHDFRKGMDLGADDYLSKPFSGDDLLSLISTRLKKIDATHENLNDINPDTLLGNDKPIENIYALSDKILARKLRKRDLLFAEGDTAKYLHFVVSGRIKSVKTNEQGKEYITKIHITGDFFGYSSLKEIGIHEETAIAIEESEIASILKQDFYQLIASNNELHAKFIKFLTSDLSESNNKLIGLAYNSARKRVAEAILYVAQKYCDDLADGISFSVCRDDLSAISGVSPESVSRNLTDLRTERLIELHSGLIKILDIKKLINLKN